MVVETSDNNFHLVELISTCLDTIKIIVESNRKFIF